MEENLVRCDYCFKDGQKMDRDPIKIVEYQEACNFCNDCYYGMKKMLTKCKLTYFKCNKSMEIIIYYHNYEDNKDADYYSRFYVDQDSIYGCTIHDKLSEEHKEMITKHGILSYGITYSRYKSDIKDIKYYSVTEEFSNKMSERYKSMMEFLKYNMHAYNIEI